jgi:DNA-binding beta-propeller fold protein YncE
MQSIRTPLLAALALAGTLAATNAMAQSLVALSGGDTLTLINPKDWKATGSVKVKGAKLMGIDVRPADNMLYAVTDNGWIVTVDPRTGAVTQKAELSTKPAAGVVLTVDFNPVADRLRIIGSDGMNLRVNVDDGKVTVDGNLKFADTDMHKGEKPNIVAGAYINSVKGTKETALYDIDGTIGALFKQAPPNDGVLTSVGKLGFKVSGPVAFNIVADGEGKNTAWLANGGTLYTVDLASGMAKAVGKIPGGAVTDIAWWNAAEKSM